MSDGVKTSVECSSVDDAKVNGTSASIGGIDAYSATADSCNSETDG